MQYPLSREEHAAIARCLSNIRKQLQDVSDLFAARYGKDSRIAESALNSLRSSLGLEEQLKTLDQDAEESALSEGAVESVIAGPFWKQ